MILFWCKDGIVQNIIYQPASLTEDEKKGAIQTDIMPELPLYKPGYDRIRRYDADTKKIIIDEIARELTMEEIALEEVKERFREEGREEIRKAIAEVELTKEQEDALVEKGVLKVETVEEIQK